MKLGLIAVASKTGLGYQTQSYYKHLNPHKTLIIDISNLNGTQQHHDWYPDATIHKGFLNPYAVKDFLQGLDCVLTAETSYGEDLYRIARQMGVKTAVVINPEFFEWWRYPDFPLPDVFILPSSWFESDIRQFAQRHNVEVIRLHHPVDTNQLTFRLRTGHKTMHNAGKPA